MMKNMPKILILSLVCASLVLAACGASGTEIAVTQVIPLLEDVLPPDVALNIRNQVSEILGVPVQSIPLKLI